MNTPEALYNCKSLKLLQQYVDELDKIRCQKYPKSFEESFLIENVYRNHVFNSDKSWNDFVKASFLLGIKQLKEHLSTLKCDSEVAARTEIINYYIVDLKRFVTEISPEYEYNTPNKGTYTDSIGRFINIFSLIHQKNACSSEMYLILAVFILRQCIETKFMEVLGLRCILNQKDIPEIIRHDYIPDFISSHSELFVFKFDFKHLKKIYKWTNVSIHTAFYPCIWEVEFASQFCADLFIIRSDSNASSETIKVSDISLMRETFENEYRTKRKGSFRFEYLDRQ